MQTMRMTTFRAECVMTPQKDNQSLGVPPHSLYIGQHTAQYCLQLHPPEAAVAPCYQMLCC